MNKALNTNFVLKIFNPYIGDLFLIIQNDEVQVFIFELNKINDVLECGYNLEPVMLFYR